MKMYDDSLELLKSISSEYSLMMGLMLGSEATITTDECESGTVPMNDIIIVETIEEIPIASPKKKRAPKKTATASN
jgi:hypothetical protein